MRSHTLITGVLLLSLQNTSIPAATIYQWSDKQGQVHFSDIAPTGTLSSTSTLQPDLPRSGTASGLRPTERKLLLQIQQRSRLQAQHAQARGLQNQRKRAEQWERCEANREKLHDSTGKEIYKQYSRYLRKHCW
jgi:hypothetical protein